MICFFDKRAVEKLNPVLVSFGDQASMIANAVRPGEEEEEAKGRERKKKERARKTSKKNEDQSKDKVLEDKKSKL